MLKKEKIIKIGTRESPLALVQAENVRKLLNGKISFSKNRYSLELLKIKTSADKFRRKPLYKIGGKALFTKEIDQALLTKKIDIAVHSLKDIPTIIPRSLEIACVLKRENPKDILICNSDKNLMTLKKGARIGTSSVRRIAQVLNIRPDLKIKDLRGNIQTRIKNLYSGKYDAILLALAGIKRLGIILKNSSILSTRIVLPAAGQGTIAVVCRKDNLLMKRALRNINHLDTEKCIAAERAFLAGLDGSCQSPIAALGCFNSKGVFLFNGLVSKLRGREIHRVKMNPEKNISLKDAKIIGRKAARKIKNRTGKHFFD